MTDRYSGAAPSAYPFDETEDESTREVVAEQAGALKDEVVEGGGRVIDTAKDRAGDVVDEAKFQATDLLRQTQAELRVQATIQQQRVADGLKAVSDELNQMARNSSGGLAADLVSRAAARTGRVASYLDARDPGSLVRELKAYAARRPGAFIAAAVVAGAVAGRLTRSLASGPADDASPATGSAAPRGLREQTPVRPPEVRRPTIQNASTYTTTPGAPTDATTPAASTAPTDPTTPLYSALITDRDDVQNPDAG